MRHKLLHMALACFLQVTLTDAAQAAASAIVDIPLGTPDGFTATSIASVGNGKYCVSGSVYDDAGPSESALVLLVDSTRRQVLWQTRIPYPHDYVGNTATNCASDGGAYYVLSQESTNSSEELNQTRITINKLSIDGQLQRQKTIEAGFDEWAYLLDVRPDTVSIAGGTSETLNRGGGLRQLVGDATATAYEVSQDDPKFSLDAQLTYYVQSNDTVRNDLAGFVCHTRSEWDPVNNDPRYQDLNKPDGYFGKCKDTDPEGYDRFVGFLKKLQFMDQVSALSGGKKLWHFHPLAFIRHFRKCGWLSRNEMLQLIPAFVIRKPGSNNSQHQGVWESPNLQFAKTLLSQYGKNLNSSMRKFKIDTPIRQACFIANATQETGWFHYLTEGNRSDTATDLHNGWFGRGFLQLTNPNGNMGGGNNNYYKYFKFLGRHPQIPPGAQELAWRNEVGRNVFHASHSAAAYWVWPDKSTPTTHNPSLPQVDSANKYADVAGVNKRRTIQTNSGINVWYYNQSFTNCATAVNYPGATGQNSPNMNGLVDRSTSFVNALIVLEDIPVFKGSNQEDLMWPENYSRRMVS